LGAHHRADRCARRGRRRGHGSVQRKAALPDAVHVHLHRWWQGDCHERRVRRRGKRRGVRVGRPLLPRVERRRGARRAPHREI